MKNFIFVIILLLGIFIIGTRYLPVTHHPGHKTHVMEKIRAHQEVINYLHDNHSLLDTSALIKVHAHLPEVNSFFTEKRKVDLSSFPCSNCHNQPLAILQANRKADIRNAHWNIELVHADANAMNCTTCHAKDNMDHLISLTGSTLDIDESFKLCGQCHSTQYKDWQGGAHGKQLNGWKPPRVAKTCVSCHDPHQPAFPKRFPARLNTHQTEE